MPGVCLEKAVNYKKKETKGRSGPMAFTSFLLGIFSASVRIGDTLFQRFNRHHTDLRADRGGHVCTDTLLHILSLSTAHVVASDMEDYTTSNAGYNSLRWF